MNPIVEDILMHYGMPRRSGRYPYGSGENPYQHSGDFLSRVQELKKFGMSETDIAKNMGLTTTQLRTQMSLARGNERSIVTSVYNRIALDVAAINIQHVKLDDEGRFLSVVKSGLNDCLSIEAKTSAGRATT